MDRTDKAEFIEDVRGAFRGTPFVILTDFKGSTVRDMDRVRRTVESSGARFQVVKNTLARIAVAETEMATLAPLFKGNIGVVFSGEDAQATAKMFRALKKDLEKLQVRGGFFDGQLLDATAVDGVADLPSREQLLSSLLATLQEGPRQVLSVMQAPARDLLYVLNNFAAKLGE